MLADRARTSAALAVLKRLIDPDHGFRHSAIGQVFTTLFMISLVGLLEWSGALNGLRSHVVDLASISAHGQLDLRLALPGSRRPEIVEVSIRDEDYRQVFQARSPLDRTELARLLEAWAALPAGKGLPLAVGIDLDLAPALGGGTMREPERRLERAIVALSRQLRAQGGGLFLLNPQSPGPPGPACGSAAGCVDQWRSRLEAAAGDGLVFTRAEAKAHQYQRMPSERENSLGVAMARQLHARLGGTPPVAPDKAEAWPVLAPAVSLRSLGFRDALQPGDRLADVVVILGGEYDPRDVLITKDGESVPGARVHAWTLGSEVHWLQVQQSHWHDGQVLLVKFVAALLLAMVLGRLWTGISHAGHAFKRQAFGVLAFLALVLGLPYLMLAYAYPLMNLGVQPAAWAALFIGLTFDAMASPQEHILTHAEEAHGKAPADDLDQALLLGWWLLQWAVICAYLGYKLGKLPTGPVVGVLATAGLFAAVNWGALRRAARQAAQPHPAGGCGH